MPSRLTLFVAAICYVGAPRAVALPQYWMQTFYNEPQSASPVSAAQANANSQGSVLAADGQANEAVKPVPGDTPTTADVISRYLMDANKAIDDMFKPSKKEEKTEDQADTNQEKSINEQSPLTQTPNTADQTTVNSPNFVNLNEQLINNNEPYASPNAADTAEQVVQQAPSAYGNVQTNNAPLPPTITLNTADQAIEQSPSLVFGNLQSDNRLQPFPPTNNQNTANEAIVQSPALLYGSKQTRNEPLSPTNNPNPTDQTIVNPPNSANTNEQPINTIDNSPNSVNTNEQPIKTINNSPNSVNPNEQPINNEPLPPTNNANPADQTIVNPPNSADTNEQPISTNDNSPNFVNANEQPINTNEPLPSTNNAIQNSADDATAVSPVSIHPHNPSIISLFPEMEIQIEPKDSGSDAGVTDAAAGTADEPNKDNSPLSDNVETKSFVVEYIVKGLSDSEPVQANATVLVKQIEGLA